MIFDEYGYPRPNGASDFEDSSHLAGILAIIEHEKAPVCTQYISINFSSYEKFYVRCYNSQYDFSRDQAWLLMVGLLKQKKNEYVRTSFITGKDLIPPSLKGVETIAKYGKPYWFQKLWAKAEIYFHAKFTPLDEPFQTIAACEAYDLYKFWTDHNKLWQYSIKRYLCELDGAWRNEPELADQTIQYIEKKRKHENN